MDYVVESKATKKTLRGDWTKPRSAEDGNGSLRKLLLANLHGFKKFEVERGFRGERDVAIAGQARAAGTCGRANESSDGCAFAASGNGPNGCASGRATADHGRGALAFALAGHGSTGSLNLI